MESRCVSLTDMKYITISILLCIKKLQSMVTHPQSTSSLDDELTVTAIFLLLPMLKLKLSAGKSWFQFNWTESWIFVFIANISILISLWLASAPPLNPCADVMSWSVKYNWPGHFATLLPRSHHHPRPPNDDDYKIGLIEVFLLFLLLHVCHLFAGSRWLRIMLLHNSLNTISTINNISSCQQHPVNDRM